MLRFTDQIGRVVELEGIPKRIISLVPSQTELLYDLGLDEEVVGITKFCIHPEKWFNTKKRVGGTKKVNFEAIEALKPDLIIANKEENQLEDIVALSEKYRVWISDIYNLADAYHMILSIGEITATSNKANLLVSKIKNGFEELQFSLPKEKQTVAYFIWNSPMMVAGNNTFIDSLFLHLGLNNVFANPTYFYEEKLSTRYPQISEEELKRAAPQYILLSSEPYPFSEKHFDQFKEICPTAKIMVVDGELFSWYGSRLLQTPSYFKRLLQQFK